MSYQTLPEGYSYYPPPGQGQPYPQGGYQPGYQPQGSGLSHIHAPPPMNPNYTYATPPPTAYTVQPAVVMEPVVVVTERVPLTSLSVADDDLTCPIIGLILGFFIPLAGWITMCVNFNPQYGRRRRFVGVLAGLVSTIVFIVTVVILTKRETLY